MRWRGWDRLARRTAAALVRLYPRPWRERYEREMLATLEMLEPHRVSLRTCLTLALCALDAHLDLRYLREELTMLQDRLHTASRRGFLVLLAGAFLVLLALVEYTFLRFPSSRLSTGTGPQANVPLWFGADGATIFYLGLGVLFGGLYLWVGSQANRSTSAWRLGALLGLVAGGVILAASLLTNALPGLSALRPLGTVALLLLPGLSGVLAARATGRLSDGVLASFWCGLVVAVLLAVSILVVDNAFAATLVHTSWAHDRTCPYPVGPALAGCEIGDDLGFVAIELAVLPLLLAGLGVVGGAIGLATSTTPTRAPSTTALPAAGGLSAWRAPLIFAGAVLALFVAEIALQLV
jgi:hypothetical protein